MTPDELDIYWQEEARRDVERRIRTEREDGYFQQEGEGDDDTYSR